jgi:hypothetical protein
MLKSVNAITISTSFLDSLRATIAKNSIARCHRPCLVVDLGEAGTCSGHHMLVEVAVVRLHFAAGRNGWHHRRSNLDWRLEVQKNMEEQAGCSCCYCCSRVVRCYCQDEQPNLFHRRVGDQLYDDDGLSDSYMESLVCRV